MPTDPRIGTTFAGYQIVSRLGRGGMSVVYLVEDPRMGRRVALKLMDASLAEDETYRERFVRESRAAAALEHPNIVPIHESGETPDGDLYLVMRYVPGGDLASLLQAEGLLSLERTQAILSQVADALDAAHDSGLVHRDVKPSNVLLDRHRTKEHAYLADFGIAKPLGRWASGSLTSTGQMLGTVDYMAPEQLEARPVDARTDVYALGCVLYECLTGEPPFTRVNPLAVMDAHRNEPPPRVTVRRPDLPASLEAVIAKAMAKEPGERYAGCGDALQGVRRAASRTQPDTVIAIVPRVSAAPSSTAPAVASPSATPAALPIASIPAIQPTPRHWTDRTRPAERPMQSREERIIAAVVPTVVRLGRQEAARLGALLGEDEAVVDLVMATELTAHANRRSFCLLTDRRILIVGRRSTVPCLSMPLEDITIVNSWVEHLTDRLELGTSHGERISLRLASAFSSERLAQQIGSLKDELEARR